MQSERRPRTWAAVLTLYFLAPMLGEVFSFNTPPLAFILDPGKFIFEPALYGSGALLIREVARRRGLGWPAILVMGAAYGVLEEAVFSHSWFNASFAGLHSLAVYGRAWDTSWVWAFGLTGFHAVFSVAIPILLTEAMYPRVAALPWLNQFWLRVIVVWFIFTVMLGTVLFGFVLSRDKGYTHPPQAYLLAIALVFVLFAIGALLRSRAQPRIVERPMPGLWSLRIFGGGMTLSFFFAFYGLSALQPFALISIGGMIATVAYSAWRVVRWSRSPGWGAEQRLALASGAFGFWIVLSPLYYTTGLPLVALAFLLLLFWLAWRTARRERAQAHGPVRFGPETTASTP
jgi:hypothetical protein